MRISYVRLCAARAADATALPRILNTRHFHTARPLVTQYLKTKDDADRVRALSALHSICKRVTDPIAMDGVDDVFRALDVAEEEIPQMRAAKVDEDSDETMLDRVENSLGALRRVRAVYNGRNPVSEFEVLKGKTQRALLDLAEALPEMSDTELDRFLHGFVRVLCRALDFRSMDRLISNLKYRLMASPETLEAHTLSRALRLLNETADRDDVFRAQISPHIIRTLGEWTFKDTLVGFQALIKAQRFDDPALFGAMLEHLRVKADTASAVQIAYAFKLLRKNEIRHTGLLKGLGDRTRVLVQTFSTDDVLDIVETCLDLSYQDPEFFAIVLDNLAARVHSGNLPWFHITRMSLVVERMEESTSGRAELAFALGRHTLVNVRTVRDETMDIVRSLCWEHRKH